MKLIFLVLLVAPCRGQSGSDDEGPRISCWSHISRRQNNSLTCRGEEEEEDGAVEWISACFRDLDSEGITCLKEGGATLTSPELHPLRPFNVTVSLRNSAPVSLTVDLRDIVKPMAPMVRSVTQTRDTHQVHLRFSTPYQRDYLSVENQRFQVRLWTARSRMDLNLSSSDLLSLDLDQLEEDAQYHVKVRSIPLGDLQGTWSDWSATYRFSTAPRQSRGHEDSGPSGPPETGPWQPVVVSLVLSLATVLAIFLFWKQKIYRLVWPQIPKPSGVDIRTSTRGLLLQVATENFSPLMLEKRHSALYSCGDAGKEPLHPPGPDPTPAEDGEASGTSSKEDAYVTMSSLYQVQ